MTVRTVTDSDRFSTAAAARTLICALWGRGTTPYPVGYTGQCVGALSSRSRRVLKIVIVYHPRRPHGADPLRESRESRESWHALRMRTHGCTLRVRSIPMTTIKVGVREFRERIASFLESDTPVAVPRRGETLGVSG